MKKLKLTIVATVMIACAVAAAACGAAKAPSGLFIAHSFTIVESGSTVSGKVGDLAATTGLSDNASFAVAIFSGMTLHFGDGEVTATIGFDTGDTAGSTTVTKFKMDGKNIVVLDENGDPEEMDGGALTFEKGKVVLKSVQSEMSVTVTFVKA